MVNTIAIVGTLDTKGEEIAYIKEIIRREGHNVLVIDVGTYDPAITPDISNEEVAKVAGVSIKELRDKADEGYAQDVMSRGLTTIVKRLYQEGKIDGIIAIGGGMGTAIATTAMRALPIGFPKVMVSTSKIVQAGIRWYVGSKDITIIHSVADILGLNRVTKKVLANAAYAISGMVKAEIPIETRKLAAATALGTTTKLLSYVRKGLEAKGYEIVVFHTVGPGGEAFEAFIEESTPNGVLDLSINELGNELFGGLARAGPTRLESAGRLGIPQVVAPGNADFINFLSPDTVPEKYRERKLHIHNPQATVMRLSENEMAKLGQVLAEKLNRSKGKVAVLIPLRGFSALDREGGVFYDPKADEAFIQALKAKLSSWIELIEVDAHINEPKFADAVISKFLELTEGRK